MKERKAEIFRSTAETEILIKLTLENQSFCKLNSGVGFLDHMLEQLSRHGNFSLDVNVKRIKSPDKAIFIIWIRARHQSINLCTIV